MHDSLGCVALWRDFPAQLAQATARVVYAYDRLGFGLSDANTQPLAHSFVITEAEQTFGMGIYQGGAVPGKELRIVNITGYDVQCCGGTHLLNTGDAEAIKILKANKVQDGIVRVTFVAGDAARAQQKSEQNVLEETAKLGVRTLKSDLFENVKEGEKFVYNNNIHTIQRYGDNSF